MCGIAGIVGPFPERSASVEAMTRRIAHRGPDGDGFYHDELCSLGHRRLAIIDLSPGGAQPMTNPSGDIVVTFNGEIYDYREHRAALERRGVRFRSESDTEVLLAMYEAYGVEFAGKLNGMFAFAIWDRRRRELVLGRDRFGQKPLYLASPSPRVFAFASEIAALRVVPGIDFSVDPSAVDALLSLHFVPSPATFHKGIRQVAPGHIYIVRDDGVPVGAPFPIARATRGTDTRSYEAVVEDAERVIGAAVDRTLVSDVPLGLFLSGGIDSTLIASFLGGGRDAFTATFPGAKSDELPYAKAVAEKVGIRLHPVHITPSAFRDPGLLVDLFQEPFADVAALPTAMLAKEARTRVTVALSGDGGDEVFGGYEHHLVAAWMDRLDPILGFAPVGEKVREASAKASKALSFAIGFRSKVKTLRRLFETVGAGSMQEAVERLRVNQSREARLLLLRPHLGALPPPHDVLRPSSLVDLFDPEAEPILPGLFLRKSDMAAMSVGFELRAPLLDNDVVSFAGALPIEHLVGPTNGKRVLRSLVEKRLGPEFASRRKMGFSPPIGEWLRKELSGLLRDLLLSPSARCFEYVRKERVQVLVEEHLRATHDHRRVLWALLVLEIWLTRIARENHAVST